MVGRGSVMGSVLLSNEHGVKINATRENRHFARRFVRFLTNSSSRDAKSRGINRQAGEINQIRVKPPQSSLRARRGWFGESAIGGCKFRKHGAARRVIGQPRP